MREVLLCQCIGAFSCRRHILSWVSIRVPVEISDAVPSCCVSTHVNEGGTGRRIHRTAPSCVLAVARKGLLHLVTPVRSHGRVVGVVDGHIKVTHLRGVRHFTLDAHRVAFQAGGVEACVGRRTIGLIARNEVGQC